jgi:hypothetical protein
LFFPISSTCLATGLRGRQKPAQLISDPAPTRF